MKRYLMIFIGIVTVNLSNAQGPLSCNPTADHSEICSGEQVQLWANASGGSGTYTFMWASTPAGFSSDLANPIAYPYQTITYHLTVNDGFETCQGDVSVIVDQRPVPNAGPDQAVPHGTWTTLQGSASGGSGSYLYHWEPAIKLVNPEAQNPQTVSLVESVFFTLSVTDQVNGCECSSVDDVTVMVVGGPLGVATSAESYEICIGNNNHLFAFAYGGSGIYTYYWTSEPPGFTSTEQNPFIYPEISQTFIVEVTDGYNLVTGSVTVIVNDCEIFLEPEANPDHICLGNSTQLFANATGGNTTLTFSWTSDPPGFESTEPNPVVDPTMTTLYYLAVTDGYHTVNDSVMVTVENVLTIYSLSNGGLICPNSSGIELMLSGSALNVTYELYRNSITTGITVPGTGGSISFGPQNQAGEYHAIGFNDGCQVQMNNIAVISYPNFKDEICIINVDSLSGKNVITWNKTSDNAISSYNIYQESTSGGNYSLIGNVEHDDPGIFTDNSTNPLQRSFSYAIATIDTCGVESTFSGIHTTMHLSINAGINSFNLIWTPYAGIEYQTYYIYRRQLPDGFQVLDSVPTSIHSYSDINPPQGNLDYMIEIRNENGCNPGQGRTQYSSVFSNIISTNVGTGDINATVNSFRIHPNPAEDYLYISSNLNTKSLVDIFLYDLQGRMVIQDRFTSKKILSVKDLNPGVYFLVLTQSNYSQYHRVIVK